MKTICIKTSNVRNLRYLNPIVSTEIARGYDGTIDNCQRPRNLERPAMMRSGSKSHCLHLQNPLLRFLYSTERECQNQPSARKNYISQYYAKVKCNKRIGKKRTLETIFFTEQISILGYISLLKSSHVAINCDSVQELL